MARSRADPTISPRDDETSLDGDWEFIPDPEHRFAPDRLPDGLRITVPGPWEAQIAEPYGIVHAWYRRRFSEPEHWRPGTLILVFGSAIARATVWLDGRHIGQHDLAGLPFEVEGGASVPGAEHDLVVEIVNPLNTISEYPLFSDEGLRAATDRLGGQSFEGLPYGKQTWYTSTSGLLGSVVVANAPDPRIAAIVVLPDLAARQATVRWRLAGALASKAATVRLTVTSPAGEMVAVGTSDTRSGETTLSIPDPEPWDLWSPATYRLDATLGSATGTVEGRQDDRTTHVASARFGMRSIATRDGTILLNGRPIFLRGVLDQDFWPLGRSNPPGREALATQVRLVRNMGLNLLRCHIKIPDPAYLDAADEAGLLVWCELPSWSRWDAGAARTARRMLARMVETMGNHPSIVAWTVINEDWGTDLRHSSRDRRWLRGTVDWLKALDPSRLVVDNSACETPHAPNFHVRTDLADFHAYRSMPDGLPRWRALIADFARRPGWLWSPHGDAAPTGDEALVLSEFGGWGLPLPSAVRDPDDGEPWWWATGETFRRPAGMHGRFRRQRLDRIWSDVDALAEATQWRQFDGLTAQIRELRREPSIQGYVITELADAFWEANGLLDVGRGPKVFHDRLAEINAPDVLLVDLPRSDLWGAEGVACDVRLASFPDSPRIASDGGGWLDWAIRLDDGTSTAGSATFDAWPRSDAWKIAELELEVPAVVDVTYGELAVTAENGAGTRAVYRQALVVVPSAMRRSAMPRRLHAVDPLDLWGITSRLETLGHELVDADDADLIVAAQVDRVLLAEVDRGRTVLLLARSADAASGALGLSRPVRVRRRRPGDRLQVQERPWDGDWSSVFAWALPGVVPGLPRGGLLGDAHREIFPDLILDGLDVGSPSDGVEVGLFSGWIHSPVALLVGFQQGSGHLNVTTLRLAPEDGPVATAMLETIVQRVIGASARRPGA